MVEHRDQEAGITGGENPGPNLIVIAIFVIVGLAVTVGFGIAGVLLSE